MPRLVEGLVVSIDIHEHVVRLVHLGEGESELTPAPVLEPVDLAVLRGDCGAVTLDHRRHLLALVRMDDETHFVMSHANSLWIKPPARSAVATRRKLVRQGWPNRENERPLKRSFKGLNSNRNDWSRTSFSRGVPPTKSCTVTKEILRRLRALIPFLGRSVPEYNPHLGISLDHRLVPR